MRSFTIVGLLLPIVAALIGCKASSSPSLASHQASKGSDGPFAACFRQQRRIRHLDRAVRYQQAQSLASACDSEARRFAVEQVELASGVAFDPEDREQLARYRRYKASVINAYVCAAHFEERQCTPVE